MRVPQFLQDQEVRFETLIHPPVFTAQKRARRLRVPGKLLAKSVLLRTGNQFLVAVLPACRQIDFDRLGTSLAVSVRLATTQEVANVFGDCEWGTTVPFGKLYGVSTIIDDSFAPDSTIVFEAQRHALTIRMTCRDFERLEKPLRMAFSSGA
ncbi:MAG: aminoacyl-tRNA deacylase [Gemmataceae bacterium]